MLRYGGQSHGRGAVPRPLLPERQHSRLLHSGLARSLDCLTRLLDRLGAKDVLLTAAAFAIFFLAPALALFAFFHAGKDKEYDFPVEASVHTWAVRLKGTVLVKDLPRYDEGDNYTDSTCVIGTGDRFYWTRPTKQGGELCTWTPGSAEVRREPIPQPKGVVAEHEFIHYFGRPALWISPRGDEVVRWEIGGNCDHGLALRAGGAGPFRTDRVELCLSNSKAVQSPDGTWYLLVWSGSYPQKFALSIYSVGEDLSLTLIGEHHSTGHHDIGVLDAAFAGDDRLHVVWADVEAGIARDVRQNWLRLRAIDLDVRSRAFTGEREVWRLDRFVGSVSPTLHVRKDGTIDYIWKVDEGEHRTPASGLFYQGKDAGKTIKLADSREGFKSLALGDQIVVCYTREAEPEEVYFRVLRDGEPGPAKSITLARQGRHALWGERMVLGARADGTFWFVNTLDAGTLYNLEIMDSD